MRMASTLSPRASRLKSSTIIGLQFNYLCFDLLNWTIQTGTISSTCWWKAKGGFGKRGTRTKQQRHTGTRRMTNQFWLISGCQWSHVDCVVNDLLSPKDLLTKKHCSIFNTCHKHFMTYSLKQIMAHLLYQYACVFILKRSIHILLCKAGDGFDTTFWQNVTVCHIAASLPDSNSIRVKDVTLCTAPQCLPSISLNSCLILSVSRFWVGILLVMTLEFYLRKPLIRSLSREPIQQFNVLDTCIYLNYTTCSSN